MALESVDLLSLLKRARKSPPSPAPTDSSVTAPLPAATALQEVAPSEPPPELNAVPPSAPRIAKVQEEEELADLRDELLSDEILIQRILGLLYRCKKENPNGGYISILDMERLLHVEREGATFVMSYMKTQKVIEMDDKSRMAITVPGIDYLRGVLGLRTAASTSSSPE